MFPHTPRYKKSLQLGTRIGLLAVLLICLAALCFTPDAQGQYEARKPTTGAADQKASLTVTEPAAGTAWSKGKRYEITWKSEGIRGGLKIELIDPKGEATVLTRHTMNSGKYSFMLMQNVADGVYKIRISTVDNKTVGVTAGAVQVGKIADEVEKALVADADPQVVVTRPTGVVGTVDQTPTTLTPDIGTVVREPIQMDDDDRITEITGTTVVQVGNLTPIQVPESDLQLVLLPGGDLAVKPDFLDQPIQGVLPDTPTITVNDPDADDFWVAGTPYQIHWGSTNLDTPVKIHMVHAVSAQQYDFYPATYNTPNTGAFTYTPPAMMGCGWANFYVQVASLDEQTKGFAGPIPVYHEPVDMTTSVVGLRLREDSDYYVLYAEKDEWLQFDVIVRNNGTQQSTTCQTVRVLVIKEPEEVIIPGGHVEFGFGNMAPRVWYKTPDPLKYPVFHMEMWTNTGGTVDLRNGAYRVEVTVDPLNLLGEDPPMRSDNTFVQRFAIR